jgi:hypothetical protein
MAYHPMTPTDEQVDSIYDQSTTISEALKKAYTAGANAELVEVEHWLISHGYGKLSTKLHACRRPVPLSLKKQAQQILAENGSTTDGRLELDADDLLAQLPNG